MANRKAFEKFIVTDFKSFNKSWEDLVQEFDQAPTNADSQYEPDSNHSLSWSSGLNTDRKSGRKPITTGPSSATAAAGKGRKRKNGPAVKRNTTIAKTRRSLTSKLSAASTATSGYLDADDDQASEEEIKIYTDSSEDDEETIKKEKMALQRKSLHNEYDDRVVKRILKKSEYKLGFFCFCDFELKLMRFSFFVARFFRTCTLQSIQHIAFERCFHAQQIGRPRTNL